MIGDAHFPSTTVVLFCILYSLTLNPSLEGMYDIGLMPNPEIGEGLIPATLFFKFDFLIRTSNFGTEAERSYWRFSILSLQQVLKKFLSYLQ